MPLMATALFAFFVAIACATFIENDFGTPVAQKWVFKSNWFAAIIIYLALCLIANMIRFRMFQIQKIGLLTFHFAFLVIVAGAICTRLTGFEGVMQIREGESSNNVISSDTYVQIKVHDNDQQYVYDMPFILDTNEYKKDEKGKPDFSHNYFIEKFDFPNQQAPVSIEFLDLIKNVKDTLVPSSSGKEYIEIVTIGKSGRQYNYLESGKILDDGGFKISLNNPAATDAVQVITNDSGIFVMTPFDLNYLQMADQTSGVIKKDSLQQFITKRLYTTTGITFAFNQYYPGATLETISSKEPGKGFDGLKVLVTQGDLKKEVVLRGGKGFYPNKEIFQLGSLNYELAYGSKIIQLPFSIFLRDFEMELYPGTENPSSFASEVTVLDHETGKKIEHRIFMNNVLDYGGYRFFQSSYDSDGLGTILSVNHDALGTNISYLGYFLLGLGFIINLFSPTSRFRMLMKKAKEIREKRASLSVLLLLFGLFNIGSSNAQLTKIVDADHAENFGRLIIQDQGGRFEPVHTLATDLLHKIYRKDTYKGQSAMQVFLGIHTNNLEWNLEPIIALPSDAIAKKLNLKNGEKFEKYACIQDFITPDMEYLLFEDVQKAHMKRAALRNEYDKDLIKVDERFNIMIGVFSGYYFKIFPLPDDSLNKWYSPFEPELPFLAEDADFVHSVTSLYFSSVEKGYETGNWSEADQAVKLIDVFQRRVTDAEIIPSKSKIEWEIRYNKMNLFKRLMSVYFWLGLLLLFMQFLQIFFPRFNLKWPLRIGAWMFGIAFVMHGCGLAIRWYLSGHAPWSNGYEAVVFIAFITVFAGILFYKQNKIILGATGIMAWLMLFVAHMNALDPEMTNLVPVLKSFWLKIHVAIITGSYGFLGLGAILGLLTMCMYIFTNETNKQKIGLISKELTYTMEMVIIVGLFMLTIGTFLGGVWANESWGRYWGWDAKETWALASVLAYAIILHFRFIPGMKSQFTMNTAALWGYSCIIMTFFGVNFYLSGLHSYAQGDPIPIPVWVPVTVISLVALNILSYIQYRKFFKNN